MSQHHVTYIFLYTHVYQRDNNRRRKKKSNKIRIIILYATLNEYLYGYFDTISSIMTLIDIEYIAKRVYHSAASMMITVFGWYKLDSDYGDYLLLFDYYLR